MKNIVLVKGNIIGMSGNHVIKNWYALVSCNIETEVEEVIEGDLVLDKYYIARPYCIYAATGNVSTITHDCICTLPRPSMVLQLYKDEIEKIQELMNVSIPEKLVSTYYRQLYIGGVGTLELFLDELLSCLVLGYKEFYENFIKKTAYKIPLSKVEESAKNMQKTIFQLIHNEVSHRLDKMGIIYHDIFDVAFPPIGKMSEKIKTRHDLVHRNGFQVKDKSLKYMNIAKSDVISFIEASNEFVTLLYNSLEGKGCISKWSEDYDWITHFHETNE